MQATHPWKARLGVGIIMLALAFLGIIITEIKSQGGLDYWKWVIPFYAISALWLSWYVKRRQQTVKPITLWHELLHWAGLYCAILLVSHLIDIGTMSRLIAGIFQLLLLSLAVFLAGIYIESIFIIVGIVLGVFAFITALLVQYMYALIIPVFIIGALIMALFIWFSHKKFNSGQT